MKLIIQIPCYNEEKTLPQTLSELPKKIDGIDTIEIQIIDDGSTDNTLKVAKIIGVDHIVRFKQNRGLAAAFKAGVDNALNSGADILVNTDADNQYCGEDIEKLVRPIINGKSDIVIGCRPIDNHPEFSFFKKKLQRFGSWVLRKVSKTSIRDAASGFRAYSKDSLLHLNIYSDFSYCMETLIQTGLCNLKISGVDIRVNRKTRESRLFNSIAEYIFRQGKTITIIFILYRANWFFNFISLIIFSVSFFLAARYAFLIIVYGAPAGNFWPTIILSGILLAISIQVYLTGIIASLISSNRKLSEEIIYRVRKLETSDKNDDEI